MLRRFSRLARAVEIKDGWRAENDQHYWDLVTVLDVLAELDPDDLPATWELDRFEQYLGAVLHRV